MLPVSPPVEDRTGPDRSGPARNGPDDAPRQRARPGLSWVDTVSRQGLRMFGPELADREVGHVGIRQFRGPNHLRRDCPRPKTSSELEDGSAAIASDRTSRTQRSNTPASVCSSSWSSVRRQLFGLSALGGWNPILARSRRWKKLYDNPCCVVKQVDDSPLYVSSVRRNYCSIILFDADPGREQQVERPQRPRGVGHFSDGARRTRSPHHLLKWIEPRRRFHTAEVLAGQDVHDGGGDAIVLTVTPHMGALCRHARCDQLQHPSRRDHGTSAELAGQVRAMRDRVQPSEHGVIAANIPLGWPPLLERNDPSLFDDVLAGEHREHERREGARLDFRLREPDGHLITQFDQQSVRNLAPADLRCKR